MWQSEMHGWFERQIAQRNLRHQLFLSAALATLPVAESRPLSQVLLELEATVESPKRAETMAVKDKERDSSQTAVQLVQSQSEVDKIKRTC